METSVDEQTVSDNGNVSVSFCQTTNKLQNALRSSVQNVLNRVTDDLFIKIYKDCYQGFDKKDDVKRPSLSGSSVEAKKYRKQFNALITQSIEETVNNTLLTTMDAKLKRLEKLKENQTDTSFVWRPPGNAMEHMIPFDTVSKMEKKHQLEILIKKEKEAFEFLKERLEKKRLIAKELHNIVQSSLEKLGESVVNPDAKDNCNLSLTVNNQNDIDLE